MTEIIIEELEEGFMPVRATDGSVGYDLRSVIDMVLEPGQIGDIPTGIAIQLPEGYEAQIRPRSGLAFKYGITVLNSPGTIDTDYRGPIIVLLINHGYKPFMVRRNDRVAQLVFNKVELPTIIKGKVNETTRGEGGFGSTGVK